MNNLVKCFAAVVFGLALTMAVAGPALADGWNWGDQPYSGSRFPNVVVTRKICRKLRDLQPPPSDRPSAATMKSLEGCNAAALYYGVGQPGNFERARQCAFAQVAHHHGDDHVFGGYSMLMMLYANGLGVDRDLGLATSLACRIHGAPAEVVGRIMHLQKLKAEDWQGNDFDYCDDITSGAAQGFCTRRNADLVDARRSEKLERLMQSWTPAQRRAFAPLHDAAKAYAKASSENEVDLTGTGRATFEIEQAEHLEKAFFELLKKLESGRGLPVSAAEYPAADAQLNAVSQRIMAIQTKPDERGPYSSKDSLPWITVTKHGIHETERVWLRYRKAWVAFAAVKYPRLDADALRTVLTHRRIAELKPFLPDPPPEKKPSKTATITFQPLPANVPSAQGADSGSV